MPTPTPTLPTAPSPQPQSSSNSRFLGCLGLVALLMAAGVAWVLLTLPKVKEYTPPDQLELTTQAVPVARQVLVLVEDSTGSPYTQPIRQEVMALTAALSDDEKVCLFQVASDQPVMPVEPWCSAHIKSTWWVMPEIKPAPYVSQAEEQAYRQATAQLAAQLQANTERAEMAWAVQRENRLTQVINLLRQLPDQPYRSLTDSLFRLLKVRHLAGQVPTDLVIYSGLVDQLFSQRFNDPVDLNGVNVQVKVMTSGGEAEKDKLAALWEPWFQAGKPAKLTFSLMEPGVDLPVARVKPPSPTALPETAGLPSVVLKPTVADRTNVVEGEPVTGDATNVTREVE